MIEKYIQTLREYTLSHELGLGDAESILELLYECHNENSPYDNEQIKADFNALYQAMNGMALREIDRVIYPVCTLCRDHERTGFVEGIKVGVRLSAELQKGD